MPHDFRQPGRLCGATDRFLGAWWRTLCTVINERWEALLPAPVRWAPGAKDTAPTREVLNKLPEDSLGFAFRIVNHFDLLWVFPRPLLLALCESMLGGEATELPPDREPTTVEHSLTEALLEALNGAMVEAWPTADPLQCQLLNPETKPRRTKMFAAVRSLVSTEFTVSSDFGASTVRCLVSAAAVQETTPVDAALPQPSSPNEGLAELIESIPVRVVARLGQATLPLSQLFRLRPGDVVLLDQQFSETLEVRVQGAPKFRGWPGRVGSRQAILLVGQPETP